MAVVLFAFPGHYAAQRNNTSALARIPRHEATAIKTLKAIHSAEATYQSTTGNGQYGSWRELVNAGLLGRQLATGQRSGYRFHLHLRRRSGTASPLVITATPRSYGTSGRRTFTIDESGVIRFSARRNPTTARMRLLVDESGGIAANETSAIASLRQIFSAQSMYQATAGNGDFGRLAELGKEKLLNVVLAAGKKNGYLFKLRVEKTSSESKSFFEVSAVPVIYQGTGVRSFFLDDSGVIRAADKGGAEATVDDAPIDK